MMELKDTSIDLESRGIFGSLLAELRRNFWICAQGSFLTVLGEAGKDGERTCNARDRTGVVIARQMFSPSTISPVPGAHFRKILSDFFWIVTIHLIITQHLTVFSLPPTFH